MPVADMLAHSHPFPLIIDYLNEGYLERCEMVGRIHLRVPATKLQNFIVANRYGRSISDAGTATPLFRTLWPGQDSAAGKVLTSERVQVRYEN
jgi:hypothetical protein